MSRDDFICPVCGATVPAKARACPECGSDEKTGWSDNTIYDDTGIEDPDEFDYEDWKRREGVRGASPSGRQKMIWLAAVVMLLLFIFLLLR